MEIALQTPSESEHLGSLIITQSLLMCQAKSPFIQKGKAETFPDRKMLRPLGTKHENLYDYLFLTMRTVFGRSDLVDS